LCIRTDQGCDKAGYHCPNKGRKGKQEDGAKASVKKE